MDIALPQHPRARSRRGPGRSVSASREKRFLLIADPISTKRAVIAQ
jgi:hypothetical protein